MVTMLPLPAVGVVMFYAGINALLALGLAILVSRRRGNVKVSVGSGGDAVLERAIRAHGNLVEYAPFILLLLLLLAENGLGALWLHVMGVTLTLGRILHAWGMLTASRARFARRAGIGLTWATMLAALILCILRGAAALGGGATIGVVG
jgi:uncharacterized membrane protein YecN with MAPEG domain